MGDTISSLLFQPPEPTRLKESHVIFLDTKLGCRIPAFFISNSAAALEDDDIDGGGPTLRSSKELTAACMTGGFGENCGTTLLYSHANAEDLGNIYPWCKFLSKALKVNVLAYDYTGYGLASGQGDPSEENCFADIDAAYSYLRYQLQIPSHKIVLYGRSLGSGPSCYLASRLSEPESEDNPVGGLILHAPFMSVFRIVLESGCTLPGDKFPNCDFAPSIRSPVLVIHGTKDNIVPFRHGEQLISSVPEKFRAKPLFIDGMGHNNVGSAVRPMFVDGIRGYLKEHVDPSMNIPSGNMETPIKRKLKKRIVGRSPMKQQTI
uniref:AB hydrolase-1 domain-containing protein n=1 Tax=Ditylum brightwellii TaxID=49249 RepID=A0A6S9A9I1_9STRA|mmetsp:Transcript_36751/g.49186  ORF Transcript_36751/g.49186 Transcript_36751/m.49186 type:complete len:320 (-) Transcript_36751:36-995(-)